MQEHTKTCNKCNATKPTTDFSKRVASRDGFQPTCRDCGKAYKRNAYAANREERVAQQKEMRAAGRWGILRRSPRLDPATSDKACGTCAVVKPYVEFNRNVAMADGLQTVCRECEKARHRRYYAANREEILAGMRVAHRNNPEPRRAAARKWAKENRERLYERLRLWRLANPETIRRYTRNANRRHRARKLMYTRNRRALLMAAPTLPFTGAQLAERLSMFTGCWVCGGPKEAIDHMKPLSKGGWHALMNLRPICRRDNSMKGDRWWQPAETVRRVKLLALSFNT